MVEHFLVWVRQSWCRARKRHEEIRVYESGHIYLRCEACKTRTQGIYLFKGA